MTKEEVEEVEEVKQSNRKMKEFVGSAMVGINQTLIGLPFDTTKVWLQNNQPVLGRPLRQFYRGAIPEFTVGILSNSIVFPIHSFTLPYTNNSFISGAIAGLIGSPLVYSFRSYKIYQQMGYKIEWDMQLKKRGRGFLASMCRESLGYSMYFGTYSILRDHDYPVFVSGSIAGLCNWGTSFPFDTIMSRQVGQKTKLTISDAIKMGKLYNGYGVCLLRSMIVNGCSFLVYETVKSLFE